jgi:hypothetical protein
VNRTAVRLAVLLAGLLPLQLAAQQVTITGRVVAGAQPVANQPVSLHRVASGGGATLAVDTTAADGRFELRYQPAQDGSIHFVATRYEGKLYIGETFRQPISGEYRLPVGPGATPIELGEATRTPGQATPAVDPAGQRAGLWVIVIAVIVLGGILLLTARSRAPHARRLLVEIAQLDNREEHSAQPDYTAQRAELIRRLRESV